MLRFITASKGLISCITDKLALGLRLGRVRLELGSGQSSIQISLNVRIRCKNGHDYEIDECARNIEILRRKTVWCNYLEEQMSGGGNCPGFSLWLDRRRHFPSRNTIRSAMAEALVKRKLYGFVFYRVTQKWHRFCTSWLYQILTDFQNYFTLRIRNNKLIRRWDSERELSLRRHCTRTKNTIDRA